MSDYFCTFAVDYGNSKRNIGQYLRIDTEYIPLDGSGSDDAGEYVGDGEGFDNGGGDRDVSGAPRSASGKCDETTDHGSSYGALWSVVSV